MKGATWGWLQVSLQDRGSAEELATKHRGNDWKGAGGGTGRGVACRVSTCTEPLESVTAT